MYLIFLLLALISLFFSQPVERCSTPFTSDNLRVTSCFHRTAFSLKYSTEYFDLISGETGKSGKQDTILKAMNESLNDLYSKNTIGYNCKYKPELYKGYKVRTCYFYPNGEKMWKTIVDKQGLLIEGMYISKFVNNESIEMAIKDYSIKQGSRVTC
jgi:hypothetical protein